MLGTQNLWAFILAGFALNVIPGPDTMYIVGRSVAQGKRAGVLSALGISSGSLCHTLAAAFGLSALLATSALAFNAIKFIGAAYLLYLGIRTLLDKSSLDESPMKQEATLGGWKIYRQGLLTNLFNPKVALFFVAFLPQFVNQSAGLGVIPFLFLGAIFVFDGMLWLLFITICSASFTKFLRQSPKFAPALKWCTGSLFIGLGLNLLRTTAQRSH